MSALHSYCKPGGVEGQKIWQVDAFTTTKFCGNPAAVIVAHEQTLTDAKMQQIAAETNMPITVFFLIDDINYNFVVIKWFTPITEIPLCGHGTLAAAHIYFTELMPSATALNFNTAKAGTIVVKRSDQDPSFYCMSFPYSASTEQPLDAVPAHILNAVAGHTPVSAHRATDTWMLVYSDESIIRGAQVDSDSLSKCPPSENRLTITAKGASDGVDCVSRVFHLGLEDAVCGSAHCTVGPYWAEALGKISLVAYQASPRGGTLRLQMDADTKKVQISGTAITVMSGDLR